MRRPLVLVILAVVFSALSIIELRHRNRLMFAQLQTVTHERDALNIEWGQLLLEQGAWSEQRRVEETARVRLGMTSPTRDQVVVVRIDRSISGERP